MKSPTLTEPQKQSIANVIKGATQKFEAQNICPEAISVHMESLGYKADDLDTNGWDYDWWLTFRKGDEAWTASGSGYYGTFEFATEEQ